MGIVEPGRNQFLKFEWDPQTKSVVQASIVFDDIWLNENQACIPIGIHSDEIDWESEYEERGIAIDSEGNLIFGEQSEFLSRDEANEDIERWALDAYLRDFNVEKFLQDIEIKIDIETRSV
ncbi:MAG: hypothetical protein H6581_31740 [Bacteroidia bacterium]|nr:hypothetical protein [Bacteroidia bacterium]